jgi:hypothetical protein
MLRSLQGEKGSLTSHMVSTEANPCSVYIGGSASISFLQLLRDTVTQSLGPSQFSHNAKTGSMLESKAQVDNPSYSENPLSLDKKLALVGVYDVAVGSNISSSSLPSYHIVKYNP